MTIIIDPYKLTSDMTVAEYAIIKFTAALLPHNDYKDAIADGFEAARQLFKKLKEEKENAEALAKVKTP